MHKNDAAYLFKEFTNEDKVKIIKMLYNKGELTFTSLYNMIGVSEDELIVDLQDLTSTDLIVKTTSTSYQANKQLIDELMNFVRTPCGCTK